MDFLFTKVKNLATSLLLNGCFAMLKIATNVWLLQNCGVIYETNTAFFSVIKPCLKIVASLPHGGKHEVDTVEQIPRAVASGGQWCPARPFEIGVPHFTFGRPVAAYIQYCILKMCPPLLVFGPSFCFLAPLLVNPGDEPANTVVWWHNEHSMCTTMTTVTSAMHSQ